MSADQKLLKSMAIRLDQRTYRLNAKLLKLEGSFLDGDGTFNSSRARRTAMMAGIVTPPVNADKSADRTQMLQNIHDNIHLYNAFMTPSDGLIVDRKR